MKITGKTNIRTMRPGFTIVELLIVIVVIGILAAITIVAYNGIQQKAQAAAASAALNQTSKKLSMYAVDYNAYPADLTTIGINNVSSTTYQYSYNNSVNPQTYCVTATNGSTSYFSSSTTPTPTAGGCAGHGVGGVTAITNLAVNPSFEVSASGWTQSPVTSIERIATGGVQGPAYLKATRTATGDAYFYFYTTPNVPLSTSYTLSFWIWADSTSSLSANMELRHYTSSGLHFLTTSSPQVSTTPTRVVMSGTTNASSSTSGLQFVGRLPAAIGSSVYCDGFMLTQGSTIYNYADGNSANWVWNDAVNASTSTGPPL